jgi:predicted chitinase
LAQGQQQGLSAAQLAYVFASAQHETDNGNTMTEYGSGRKYNGRADLGNTQPGDGPRFKGRGFVQLTGRANYTTYSGLTGQDLVGNPGLAADPQLSAFITIHGMANGVFTGRRLDRYLNDGETNFYRARRVVNADLRKNGRRIAGYAQKYLDALKNCGY